MMALRFFPALLALAALSACEGPGQGPATRTLALYGGAVTAAGPASYCVDNRTSRPGRGFALMAACARLGEDAPVPFDDAVLSLQIGGDQSASVTGNETEMIALLRATPPSGLGGSIEAVDGGAGAVFATLDGTGEGALAGTLPPLHRAFFDINGRLAVLTVLPYAAAPVTANEAQGLATAAVSAIRSVNRTPTTETPG